MKNMQTFAILASIALVLTLAACGSSSTSSAVRPTGKTGAKTTASSATTAAATAPANIVADTGAPEVGAQPASGEAADPEEAHSDPAPASARHAAASSPAKAGELVIAAGAPSNAEIKRELEQMAAVESSAHKSAESRLKPVPGGESIGGDGKLPIPATVPEVIQKVIAGANEIADFPYVFGGGHASFVDNAYDCSGSVSYALAAGGLLSRPEVSGELESWGVPGPGRYITVFANAGHTYMYVDGVLYDTAGRSGVYASRWQIGGTDNSGYVERHYPGL